MKKEIRLEPEDYQAILDKMDDGTHTGRVGNRQGGPGEADLQREPEEHEAFYKSKLRGYPGESARIGDVRVRRGRFYRCEESRKGRIFRHGQRRHDIPG